MWCTQAMRSRSTDPAATGRRNRSWIHMAASSAIPASRYRSVRATVDAELKRTNTRRTRPGGACQLPPGFPLPGLFSRRLPLHVVEHGRGRPTIDLEPVGLLIGAERGAREHAGL